MSLTIWALVAALAALGIFLVLAFLSVLKLVEKLKNKHDDFFKAKIKKRYETMGVDVIDIEVQDVFGNTISEESYAGLDGISSSLYSGKVINKYSS